MVDIVEIGLLIFVVSLLLWPRQSAFAAFMSARNAWIIDSCALIDGRILNLAKADFGPGTVIIPQFVLRELQLLADKADASKRERARFGLDIAQSLQALPNLRIKVDQALIETKNTIDDKLIQLAKKRKAALYTVDLNLNKVASMEGVRVLNVHELAHLLRPIVLPGEILEVKIIQKGEGRDQGVGYLEDGTMVVVEHAAKFVSHTVHATVVRMHHTAAGRMIFATRIPKTRLSRN